VLIDLYAKCGSIDKAYELLHGLRKRDVVAYSAMIYRCGINGRASDAVKLFERMTGECIIPNLVTYTGILTAYNHAGLVEEGYRCFESMKALCLQLIIMESWLIFWGGLDEAYKLIMNMPADYMTI
jgi:pentatricopeptide repeat protein